MSDVDTRTKIAEADFAKQHKDLSSPIGMAKINGKHIADIVA